MRELTEMFQGSGVIGKSGITLGRETARINALSLDVNLDKPRSIALIQIDPFVAGGLFITLALYVHLVLRAGARSEVLFAVVKTIVVAVIGIYLWISKPENLSVHKDNVMRFRSPRITRSIKGSRCRSFTSVPLILAQFLKIFVIDKSDLTLSQWNGFHANMLSHVITEGQA